MRRIVLFGEDFAHQEIVGALVRRIAGEANIDVNLDWRSATKGRPQLVSEYERFMRDLDRQEGPDPDMVVVATDANCVGLSQREREIPTPGFPIPLVKAIPDPHIERWLLLDGAAFRAVFGAGCNAPDRKCVRNRYKELLIRAIHGAGTKPILGGIEYADDLVRQMNLERAGQADKSFKRFAEALRSTIHDWC